MTEEVVEYNPQGELKFIRLRSLPDDLVGYVKYKEECIVVGLPLRIEIETIFEEGRQILSLQEYLPQSVIELKEIEFYNDEVLFVTPVRPEFVEQYEHVSNFFYNNAHAIKDPKKAKKEMEKRIEATEKVVSIIEALQAKKDKPIH